MKTIFKIHKRDYPFVLMDKRPLESPDLSYKAKGILAYLLSRPDDWEVNLQDLINRALDGRDAVKSGLDELETAGHLRINQERDSEGKWTRVVYSVYEIPLTENPLADNPLAENPSLTNNEYITNNDSSNIFNQEAHLLDLWSQFFPDKVQPRAGTYRTKIRARINSGKWTMEDWHNAMDKASRIKYLKDSGWFQFEYTVRNNDNIYKILNGVFDTFDKMANPKKRINTEIWEQV